MNTFNSNSIRVWKTTESTFWVSFDWSDISQANQGHCHTIQFKVITMLTKWIFKRHPPKGPTSDPHLITQPQHNCNKIVWEMLKIENTSHIRTEQSTASQTFIFGASHWNALWTMPCLFMFSKWPTFEFERWVWSETTTYWPKDTRIGMNWSKICQSKQVWPENSCSCITNVPPGKMDGDRNDDRITRRKFPFVE